MIKKYFYMLIVVLFLVSFGQVFATVVINEVQIETDANKDNEFIELYNNGTNEVILTGFSIYKKTSSGTESSVVSASRFENKKIAPLSYLFLAREGEYSGSKSVDIYWPSSYSLAANNSLTLYKDYDSKMTEDSVSWGEVKNFKRANSNTNTGTNTNQNNNTNTTPSNTQAGGAPASVTHREVLEPRLQIKTKKFAFTGSPVPIEAIIENQDYRNLYGKFYWNLGDGTSREIKSLDDQKFEHTYYYPGEYLVDVEYFKSNFSLSPDLKNQIIIEVVSPTIVISNTGIESDFFIELENKSTVNIDMSNFILKGKIVEFIFPKNTTLAPSKKIILSPKITNLSLSDKNYLEIRDPSNKIIYSQKNIKTISKNKKIIPPKNTNQIQNNFSTELQKSEENNFSDYGEYVEGEDLAGASLLAPYEELQNNINPFYIFGGLLFGASLLVYIIRRQNKKQENDDEEFEILDE